MRTLAKLPLAAAPLLELLAGNTSALAASKIKYVLGDVVSIDELPLLIAVERAKKRGVEIEVRVV